jgi:hypothetical protein
MPLAEARVESLTPSFAATFGCRTAEAVSGMKMGVFINRNKPAKGSHFGHFGKDFSPNAVWSILGTLRVLAAYFFALRNSELRALNDWVRPKRDTPDRN